MFILIIIIRGDSLERTNEFEIIELMRNSDFPRKLNF